MKLEEVVRIRLRAYNPFRQRKGVLGFEENKSWGVIRMYMGN